ncbi:MAG: YbaB/EbfC family nucleoid-associated protein [Eggerthellales bacterium]|nr:YbaB/EbfC family nucleoid-associated protein [Eggerthellales bacterium]
MAANNMKNMMRQAQQMQMKMQKVQEEIQSMTYESSAGGGMVKATVQGNGRVLGVEINPIVVDPSDVEMLQDLVVTAINSGFDEISSIGSAKMAEITGGMKIPGM